MLDRRFRVDHSRIVSSSELIHEYQSMFPCMFIFMHIKRIFIWKVLHEAFPRNRGKFRIVI